MGVARCKNKEGKSISLLPTLGQGADGRFDSRVFSRTVTPEQAILPGWQQLCLGVWEFIRQEFQALGGMVSPCKQIGEST